MGLFDILRRSSTEEGTTESGLSKKRVGLSRWVGRRAQRVAKRVYETQADDLEERAKRIWDHYDQDQQKAMTDLAYSLSFASPESDFTSQRIQDLLSAEQREQLANCEKSLDKYDTHRELLLDERPANQDQSAEELRTLQHEVSPPEEEQFHFEEIFARNDSPLPHTRSKRQSRISDCGEMRCAG